MSSQDEIYEALLHLPVTERLRLVERVIHELVLDAGRRGMSDGSVATGASVIGVWADEPGAVDDMVENILRERENRSLRTAGDATRDG